MGPYLTLLAKREMKKVISETSDILQVAVNVTGSATTPQHHR